MTRKGFTLWFTGLSGSGKRDLLFGGFHRWRSIQTQVAAPTGTVVLALLTFLMGFILFLQAVNLDIVQRTIDAGAEVVIYGDDMGMQVGPMLTPDQLRTYIKPSYQRLIAPAKEAG